MPGDLRPWPEYPYSPCRCSRKTHDTALELVLEHSPQVMLCLDSHADYMFLSLSLSTPMLRELQVSPELHFVQGIGRCKGRLWQGGEIMEVEGRVWGQDGMGSGCLYVGDVSWW